MKLEYTVHSCVEERAHADVEFRGQTVNALVPAIVVELVHDMHGHTFRFVPTEDQDVSALKAMFQVGAGIDVNFTRREAPKAKRASE